MARVCDASRARLSAAPSAAPPTLTEYVRVVLEPAVLAPPPAGGPASSAWLYTAITFAWLCGIVLLIVRWIRLPACRSGGSVGVEQATPATRARVEEALAGTAIETHGVRITAGAIPSVRGLIRPTIRLPFGSRSSRTPT